MDCISTDVYSGTFVGLIYRTEFELQHITALALFFVEPEDLPLGYVFVQEEVNLMGHLCLADTLILMNCLITGFCPSLVVRRLREIRVNFS